MDREDKMKISQIENKYIKNDRRMFSFEIFPPKGDLTIESLDQTVSQLIDLSPAFISVTYSAGGSGNSFKTIGLASMIKKKYGIESMAHLTCISANKDIIEKRIEEMKSEGIDNVLALRGDLVEGTVLSNDFRYATDIIPILKESGLSVSAACYPEGHVQSESLEKDIYYMKMKEDMGVEHFISQLFFNNTDFYDFIEKIQKAGIKTSVSAGIMPILSKSQVTRMIFTCGASLPAEIIRILNKYDNDQESLIKAGVEYAIDQICGLLDNTSCPIHLYTMNKPELANNIVSAIREKGYKI